MYDYNFGIKGDIRKNPEEFLIFAKRMLPRWANGTPDSECVAIFKILKSLRQKKRKKLLLVETGCGASTLTMFLHCALYGGTIYSWDINPSRGSFLRSVITESIGRILKTDVNKIWNFVGYNSADKNIGIQVLKELNKHSYLNKNIKQPDTLINDSGVTASAPATGSALTVDTTAGFPTSGTLLVGTEQITYTGLTSTTFTGITRGANSTTAAIHLDDATIKLMTFIITPQELNLVLPELHMNQLKK